MSATNGPGGRRAGPRAPAGPVMPTPDFRSAEHLPNLCDGRPPAPRRWLPRQRRGRTPQMVGRYPDFDVLAPEIVGTWDAGTCALVMSRLRPRGALRFFQPEEVPTARAFCDLVMAQDEEPRVPVLELLDAKYAEGRLDGYQYAGMPDDREAWHLLLRGLDHTARTRYGRQRFSDVDPEVQRAICEDFRTGALQGGPWESLDVARAWSLALRSIVSEFYSHPWAWNEIGYGGPAYPRGFMRMGDLSTEEPFETPDRMPVDAAREAEEPDRS
jgi:hypothetical protein